MPQIGGKPKKTSSDSKRHFTVVMGGKEHGLYASSSPSSAARKAVTKLCTANKSKKVQFHIREITQGSKKKTYGPYEGHIEKLKEPIKLKGREIKYKPVAKLGAKKVGQKGGDILNIDIFDQYSSPALKNGLEKLTDEQRNKFGLNGDPSSILSNSKCHIWILPFNAPNFKSKITNNGEEYTGSYPYYIILKINKGYGRSACYIAFRTEIKKDILKRGQYNRTIYPDTKIIAIGNDKEDFVRDLNYRDSNININMNQYKDILKTLMKGGFNQQSKSFAQTQSEFLLLKIKAE